MSNTIESLELEIVSNSKSAVDGIDALTQSLEKLKSATKGGLGLSKVAKETKKLEKAMDDVSDDTKDAGNAFTDFYYKLKSGVMVIKQVSSKLWDGVEKSNDYVENLNLFTVSMGEYASEALNYAETVSDAMGIDTSEWIRAQGVFMTMATGFGVANDRAATMSKNLTQLGYDLSSFYNMDVGDAMTKLKSGLAGELEPLRAIGYDLSQAKLEATAAELGITKTVSAMTQAEKAQLRYYAIMTQVTVAQGDMARTLDDPANQLRVLKAQTSMAAREIGNIFIPALNAILPYAIAGAKVIGNLASSIAGLFGYEAPEIDNSMEGVVSSTETISENLEEGQKEAKKLKSYMLGFDELNVINPNTGSELDGASEFEFELPEYDFMEGLVDSKVSAIVEDMKEWLGITEDINSWSELLATNFGNILVSVGLIGVGIVAWKIAEVVTDTKKLTKLFKSLSTSMKLMGIALKAMGAAAVIAAATAGAVWLFQNTEDTITKIGAVVSAASLAVGAILAFTGINLPLGIALMAVGALSMGTAIAMNTTQLSDEVKGIIATITGIVSVALLGVGAVLAFTGANIPLGIALMAGGAVTLATAIAPNWNYLVDALQGPVGGITALVSGALLALGAILTFTGVSVPLGVGLMVAGAAGLVTVAALNWNSIVDALQGPVGGITALVSGALIALGAILLFTGVGIPLGLGLMLAGAAGLGTVVAVNWNYLTDKVSEVWNGIVEICSSIATWFNDNVITPIVDFFKGLWTSVSSFFVELWNDIVVAWTEAPTWFNDYIITPVVEFFKGLWEDVVSLFTSLWDGIVAIWNTVATWFNNNVVTPIVDFFKGVWTSVSGFFSSLWNDIVAIWTTVSNWFDENIITPISDFFEGLTMRIGQFFEGCWLIIQAVWLIASTWFNDNVITPLISFFSGVWESVSGFFSSLWNDIVAIWNTVATWFDENVVTPISDFFSGLWISVLGFFSSLWDDIVEVWTNAPTWFNDTIVTPIVEFFSGLWTSISGFFSSLWDGIVEIWTNAPTWFNETIVVPIVDFFKGVWTDVSGFFSDLWGDIKDVWDKVSTWFNDNVVTPVANFFEGLWTSVSGFFSSLWDDIKAVWDKVSGWFDDNIISPVKTAFDTACEAIGGFFSSLWEGIKKGIASAMNAVIGAIESTINWVIGGINNLIGGFNKVVQWAADVLGQDWSGITLVQEVSLKRITFAEGGFPEQGQMFIAREAGAEMVGNIGRRTAVANNDQIVSGIAGGVAQANEEQNALLREQNTLLRALLEKDSGVYLDGKNLTNSVEKYQRERGRVLIAGGVV